MFYYIYVSCIYSQGKLNCINNRASGVNNDNNDNDNDNDNDNNNNNNSKNVP